MHSEINGASRFAAPTLGAGRLVPCWMLISDRTPGLYYPAGSRSNWRVGTERRAHSVKRHGPRLGANVFVVQGDCVAATIRRGAWLLQRAVFYSANRIDKSMVFTSLVSVLSEM